MLKIEDFLDLYLLFDAYFERGGVVSKGGFVVCNGNYDLDWDLSYKGTVIIECILGELNGSFSSDVLSKDEIIRIMIFCQEFFLVRVGENERLNFNTSINRHIREQMIRSLALENRDIPRIDKVLNAYFDGTINRSNYYDKVRSFTKKVSSDHSIKRWQIIADGIFGYLYDYPKAS